MYRGGDKIIAISSTSETIEFRTQFPAMPPSTHNRLANIHRNYLESTQLAQRRTIHQQNDQIPARFPEKSCSSQKAPANHERGVNTTILSTRPDADVTPDPDTVEILNPCLRYNTSHDCKIQISSLAGIT